MFAHDIGLFDFGVRQVLSHWNLVYVFISFILLITYVVCLLFFWNHQHIYGLLDICGSRISFDFIYISEVALIGLRVCQWQQEVLDIPKFCSPEFVGSWQLWVAIGTNRWQLGATKSLISWSLVNFVLYPLNSSLPAISAKLPNICHGTNPATLALDKANRKAQLSKQNVLILRLLAS